MNERIVENSISSASLARDEYIVKGSDIRAGLDAGDKIGSAVWVCDSVAVLLLFQEGRISFADCFF